MDDQIAGRGYHRVRIWLFNVRSNQSFPGIEPGDDWSPVQPENAVAGLELASPTW